MRISFDNIVRALRELGIKAYVEQTGGQVACIYVGVKNLDDGTYQVIAGPGWFEGPSWTLGHGDTDDFYIGGDDLGEGPVFEVSSESEAVDEIVRQMGR